MHGRVPAWVSEGADPERAVSDALETSPGPGRGDPSAPPTPVAPFAACARKTRLRDGGLVPCLFAQDLPWALRGSLPDVLRRKRVPSLRLEAASTNPGPDLVSSWLPHLRCEAETLAPKAW